MKEQNFEKDLLRICTHLLKYDRELPLSRVQIFLLVATNDGLIVSDIVQRTGLAQPSVSRNLMLLGDRPSKLREKPLNWVETRPDPTNYRRVTCHVTQAGRQVLRELAELV